MKSATINILGSSALSQLLIVASTPFLTRHYEQAEFGWFGLATTVSLLMSTVLTLRLEHSIHASISSPSKLFSVCLHLTALLVLVIILPTAIILPESIAVNRGNLYLIIFFATAHAICACATINLNFNQKFRSIAYLNLAIPTIFVSGTLIFSDTECGVNQLLFWQAIAYAVGAISALAIQRQYLVSLTLTEFKNILSTQRQNIQFLVPSSILSILSLNLSVIGATLLFDNAIAGLVVIAQRVARAPIGVVGNSLNEVLRSSIPKRKHIYPTFMKVAYSCFGVALLMLITVVVVPEPIYGWALGENWSGLKTVLIITVTGACFQLIATSVFSLLTTFNKKVDMQINLALVVSGLIAFSLTYQFNLNASTYLWIHTLLSALTYTTGFLVAYRVARTESESKS